MTIFGSKDAFVSFSIEQVKASGALVSQDCSICTKPLAVQDKNFSPQSALRGYHIAVRISSCGCMHGKECLDAWLDIGNSCPTCKRILFEFNGHPITQHDVENLITSLGPEYGEVRIMVAVAGMLQKQEQEHALLRRVYEQEVARQEGKNADMDGDGFMLSGDDLFSGSDEEMGLEEQEGDKEYVVDDEEMEEYAKWRGGQERDKGMGITRRLFAPCITTTG